jgi:hypothetical protein
MEQSPSVELLVAQTVNKFAVGCATRIFVFSQEAITRSYLESVELQLHVRLYSKSVVILLSISGSPQLSIHFQVSQLKICIRNYGTYLNVIFSQTWVREGN